MTNFIFVEFQLFLLSVSLIVAIYRWSTYAVKDEEIHKMLLGNATVMRVTEQDMRLCLAAFEAIITNRPVCPDDAIEMLSLHARWNALYQMVFEKEPPKTS